MKRFLSILLVTVILVVTLGAALPAQAATPLEIGNAIDKGLAYLATQQNANGSFGSSGYYLAETASAVLAFEDEGHFPGGVTPYASVVEKGLDYIFLCGYTIAINNQTAGYAGRNDNPDTNGNGSGIFFVQAGNTYNYETGMVMLAIVASTKPNRVVTTGSLTGKTYAQVIQDMVDYVAWGQIDGGSGRGGWRYEPEDNNTSAAGDNSVAQWPVLGLVAAQQWGFNAPQFVKNELNYWIDYVQNDFSGGSGYSGPDDYVNSSKTGGLLIEMYYVGDNKTTVRALAALNFINVHWNDGLDGWYGNKAHPYAMFATFKGLELMGVTTIPNALANTETPAGDWWGDYCEYLVNAQLGTGNWNGYYYWPTWMTTAWYVIILQSTLFPIQVNVDVPASVCGPYTVNINYTSERFWVSGAVTIYKDNVLQDTVTLTNFHGTATWTSNVSSDTPGPHEWKGMMDVTPVTGGAPIHAENAATVLMCQSPTSPGPEVGGDIYPVSKVALLTPWIVSAIILVAGTGILIWRRRTQS